MREETVHIPLAGVRLVDCRGGGLVDLGGLPGVQVLTLVRHRHCHLCQEHVVRLQRRLAVASVPLVCVGFSPAGPLGALADRLGLAGPVLSDPERHLYGRLGFGRAPLWQVYSPSTVWFYLRRALRAAELQRPVEDIRQLGGDALCVDGVLTRRWRPATPSDRADPARIAAAARAVQR